jgi:uncharacterized protein (DUF697 family)
MTDKTVNYTDEMVARMKEVYGNAANEAERAEAVEALADEMGKTVRGIRAKLVAEGVYIAKAKTAGKAGKAKAELVKALAEVLDLDEGVIETIEKANKVALVRILGRVTALKEAAE